MMMRDDIELDADYVPEYMDPSDGEMDDEEEAPKNEEDPLPGVVNVFLPRLSQEDRERTPRRRESIQSTVAPTEGERPEDSDVLTSPASPKRKLDTVPEGSPQEKTARTSPSSSAVPAIHEGEVVMTGMDGSAIPVPDDDDLVIDDINFTELPEDAPQGWRVVDGYIEMDDIMMAAIRKGEVNERKLSPEDRAKFVEGKKNELNQYFSNAVWQIATGSEIEDAIKSKRVITARWVLTWKKVESEDGIIRWKAKARLVLRGFQDPDILSMKTASPTAGRTARMFLLMTATWLNWSVYCADVKAAFLSGKGFSRSLIVRLPADCLPLIDGARQGLYNKHLYMRMLKSAYGLCDAPLLWYEEATSRLTKRGWIKHPIDQCCFMKKASKGHQLLGLLILHVDDMLVAGNYQESEFQDVLKYLKADFDFGKWDELGPQQPLKYCGGTILQTEKGIEVSYEEYIKKICPMNIGKHRKDEDDITPAELSAARGLIGALQWPATQGMPILCASMSIQAGEIPKGQVRHLKELNKTLRFAKANASVTLKFLAKPKKKTNDLNSLCLICYADAAFSVRRDLTSQGGFVILACEKGVLHGEKQPASILSWRSFKVPRVCRSSLAAECQACATALEELLMLKTFLQVLKQPGVELKESKGQLHGECAMVTDCKALYDAVHRETIQQATDKRVAIEGLVIKDLLHDLHCQWRWVSSERQLSDGLTKVGARQSFVERFVGSHVQLVADYAFTAAKKKSREERAGTVSETRTTRSEVATALVAMVMASTATSVGGSSLNETVMVKEDEWSGIDMALMVTLIVGALTLIWLMQLLFHRCQGEKKEGDETADDDVSQTMADLLQENEDLKMENQKWRKENEFLRQEMQKANAKVRSLHQDLHTKSYGSKPKTVDELELIFIAPQGECWHVSPKCAGSSASSRRRCHKCCH